MNLKALKILRLFHLLSKRKYDEKRQIELVNACPLFDAKWYLEQNPDVRAKKMGAARHYAKVGWKEGRNPSKEFSTKDYVRKYPELISKNWCPLFHYMLEHKELISSNKLKAQQNITSKYKFFEHVNTEYAYNPLLLLHPKFYFSDRKLQANKYEKAIVLPLLDRDKGFFKGGVVDNNNKYIDISAINPSIQFDNYRIDDVERVDLDVVYIGGFCNHYGHFLIEMCSRLWYVLQNNVSNVKLAYATANNLPLSPVILDFMHMLGIKDEQLLHVTKITQFKSVIIPEVSTEAASFFTKEYKNIFDKVSAKISPIYHDKVYLSRTQFKKAQESEFGEDVIEKIFAQNGYTVIHPHLLSLKEQIAIFKGCKHFAFVSGTLGHNMLFAPEGSECVIINKTSLFNNMQCLVNELRNLKVTYIDCYLEFPYVSMGWGPFLMINNQNMQQYCRDHSLSCPPIEHSYIEENVNSYIEKYKEYNEKNLLRRKVKNEDVRYMVRRIKDQITKYPRLMVENDYKHFFDKVWYLKHYQEVGNFGISPIEHFDKIGWKKGYNPSKYFDTEYYLAKYPDVKRAKINPLKHYLVYGKNEGRICQRMFPGVSYVFGKLFSFRLFKKAVKAKVSDYKVLSKSKYFDKKWYLKTYPDVKRAKMDPIEHYLKFGWKEGRNPGPKFSTEGYVRRYSDVKNNPLLHYELVGKGENRKIGTYINDAAISEYFLNHANGKADRVVYSCISGDYDDVVTDFYPDPRYDYVLFTDSKKLLKNKYYLFWQVKPLQFKELDSVRNARWHKLHPHLLFPDYKYSVWIDSNVQIKGNQIYNYLEEQVINNNLLASAIHPYRNCLYQEARECVQTRKDNPEVVYQQIDIIRKSGFPKNYGLFETNVLFRQHNNEHIISLMNEWWGFIEKYSRRDQLSFTYVLWKNNEKCYSLGNNPLRFNPEFKLYQHAYKPHCKINTSVYAGNQKGKLLVHLHLYYHEQLKYFISKLKNITCNYDLFVTYVDESTESNARLKKFKKDVHLIKVPNKGYDLAPFVYILNLANLDNYKYILKLHTKNFRTTYWSYNNIKYIKYEWRNALVNALLGSKRVFKKNLRDLQNEFVGMIGNADLISHKGATANEKYRLDLCQRLDYNPDLNSYIAGTMFICKSFLMKDIQNLHLTFDDFQSCTQTGITGTLAHALESVLGHTVENNGMLIKGRRVLNIKALFDKWYAFWVKFRKGRKHSDYWHIKHSRYFNKKWYLKTYPDVKQAKKDPIEHYLKFGWKEGRNPGPEFNTNWYLKRYKDVAAAKINPLLHYERNGKWEGRQIRMYNVLQDDKFLKIISEDKTYGVSKKKRNVKIIVSLTSFPARINEVAYTVYSLLHQTLKPDEIVLWLGHDKFANKERDLPEILLKMKDRGLTIKWCKDLRSYTKLVPSLKAYPNDIIVTADDDIYYDEDWLEKLYKSYLLYPDDIHCHRVHRITFGESDNILPYKEWRQCYLGYDATYQNFLTGVGGVLYPPHSLYKDVLKSSLFAKLAPLADDIWFWAMAVLQGTKIRSIKKGTTTLKYVNPDREYGLTEGATLASENVVNGRNDEQLKNVVNYYPLLMKYLYHEINNKRK